jgi:predicted AAA+ superfamily ATPase
MNKMPKKRILTAAITDLALKRNKMAFVSGPRQSGKTTMSRILAKSYNHSLYCNWDETRFRRQWTKDPQTVLDEWDLSRRDERRLLVLDEIHKSKLWKQKLKGIFDHFADVIQIVVTGSARLNVYNRGGDSLMGRYIHFRLYPFSLREMNGHAPPEPDILLERLFSERPPANPSPSVRKNIGRLFEMSGFPEPLFEGSPAILNIWRRGRIEKIVREDLRDLSRIPELSQIEMLVSLLPEKVGSPLSLQSLREDLEVSFDTVKRWMNYLNQLYYFFEIRPWTRSIPRSLKKEPKIYLYDWTEIESDGPRFENFIAFHLWKLCHYWTDIGVGAFQLHYLRNKEKQEVDFLISRGQKPWLTVECKTSDGKLDPNFMKFQKHLKCPHVQVIWDGPRWQRPQTDATDKVLITSADFFLSELI